MNKQEQLAEQIKDVLNKYSTIVTTGPSTEAIVSDDYNSVIAAIVEAMGVQQEGEVEELINAYENYLNVLNDELNDSVSMESVHGWKSRNIDRGEEARKRISAAKEAISAPAKAVEAMPEKYLPPDNGDICWQVGSETFTRKEVAHLLHTQRAMISNDLKAHCGNSLTPEMFDIINNPRTPNY